MRLVLPVLLATALAAAGPVLAQATRPQQPPTEGQQEDGAGKGERRQAPPADAPSGPRRGERQPAAVLVDQAHAAFQAGRYADAEKLYRQALSRRARTPGGDFPFVLVLNRLGYCLVEQGHFAEGEALFRRALATAERSSDGDHSGVALSLNNLGYALRRQGRQAEAEPIVRRSLEMRERLLGPNHPDVANSLYSLAQTVGVIRRPGEAEPLLRRALEIREAAFGPDHPLVAQTYSAIAAVMRAAGKTEDAEALMRRAVAIQESRLGPGHPRLALALNALGMAQLSLKRFADAEATFRRAVALREAALGPGHPDTAQAYGNLAFALARQQRGEEALAAIRKATAIHIARRAREESRGDEIAEGERRSARWLFARHVGIAYALGQQVPERRAEAMREAFEMQQWAQAGAVGGALARMSARFAAGDGPLSALIRERQDAQARREALDRALIEAAARPVAERSREQEAAARADIAALDRRINALDARLQSEFPRYEELASVRPLPLSQARDLVAPDEAMLVYLARDDDTFLWIVRKDRVVWRRLAPDRHALDQAVKALRAWLDPVENRGLAPMPLAAAHALYHDILPGAEEALRGIKHLLVVADGPLQSLPFAVLTTAPPASAVTTLADYADAPWLIRRYAISVLPSVGSLRSLRAVAPAARDRAPFIGYGDPELAGPPAGQRIMPLPRVERGVADVAAVRAMEPLPESAIELRAMAESLRAGPQSVFLRRAATETAVKSADLQGYRVVAFATHGLMAGEFGEYSEPALVLTPPAVGTAADDGLLMASEIAQLRLDADWVILSACNTAAPDGTPGAEGLSGLAKAFIYAGARSLLVSHWAVASDAAVRLTTGAVAAMDRAPAIGRAEALRRSMLALLADKATLHPMFWAPFVLVGEGGAAR